MTIEYGNSEFTRARRDLIAARAAGALCSRRLYYWDSLSPIFLFGAGSFAAFSHESSPIFLILGFVLGARSIELMYQWRPYESWLNTQFFPGHLNSKQRRIRMELTDEGMQEHQGDIVSLVPWKDVWETVLEDNLLVIKLSSGQEAHIPRHSFGISELNLENIRTEVDKHRSATKQDGEPVEGGKASPATS